MQKIYDEQFCSSYSIPKGKWEARIRYQAFKETQKCAGLQVYGISKSSLVYGVLRENDVIIEIDSTSLLNLDCEDAKVKLKNAIKKKRFILTVYRGPSRSTSKRPNRPLSQINDFPAVLIEDDQTTPKAQTTDISQPKRKSNQQPFSSSTFPKLKPIDHRFILAQTSGQFLTSYHHWTALKNLELFYTTTNETCSLRSQIPFAKLGIRCRNCKLDSKDFNSLRGICIMSDVPKVIQHFGTNHFPFCKSLSQGERTSFSKIGIELHQREVYEYLTWFSVKYNLSHDGTKIFFKCSHDHTPKPAITSLISILNSLQPPLARAMNLENLYQKDENTTKTNRTKKSPPLVDSIQELNHRVIPQPKKPSISPIIPNEKNYEKPLLSLKDTTIQFQQQLNKKGNDAAQFFKLSTTNANLPKPLPSSVSTNNTKQPVIVGETIPKQVPLNTLPHPQEKIPPTALAKNKDKLKIQNPKAFTHFQTPKTDNLKLNVPTSKNIPITQNPFIKKSKAQAKAAAEKKYEYSLNDRAKDFLDTNNPNMKDSGQNKRYIPKMGYGLKSTSDSLVSVPDVTLLKSPENLPHQAMQFPNPNSSSQPKSIQKVVPFQPPWNSKTYPPPHWNRPKPLDQRNNITAYEKKMSSPSNFIPATPSYAKSNTSNIKINSYSNFHHHSKSQAGSVTTPLLHQYSSTGRQALQSNPVNLHSGIYHTNQTNTHKASKIVSKKSISSKSSNKKKKQISKVTKPEKDPFDCIQECSLLEKSDRGLITEYIFLAVAQLEAFQLEGRKGIRCRHCAYEKNSHCMFPTKARHLKSFIQKSAQSHVMLCKSVPKHIVNTLKELQQKQTQEYTKIPASNVDYFYQNIWETFNKVVSAPAINATKLSETQTIQHLQNSLDENVGMKDLEISKATKEKERLHYSDDSSYDGVILTEKKISKDVKMNYKIDKSEQNSDGIKTPLNYLTSEEENADCNKDEYDEDNPFLSSDSDYDDKDEDQDERSDIAYGESHIKEDRQDQYILGIANKKECTEYDMNHTQEADESSFYDTDSNTGADSEDYDENDDDFYDEDEYDEDEDEDELEDEDEDVLEDEDEVKDEDELVDEEDHVHDKSEENCVKETSCNFDKNKASEEKTKQKSSKLIESSPTNISRNVLGNFESHKKNSQSSEKMKKSVEKYPIRSQKRKLDEEKVWPTRRKKRKTSQTNTYRPISIVKKGDKNLIPAFNFVLLNQFERIEDRNQNFGVQCKHCSSSFKVFLTSERRLRGSVMSNLYPHIKTCQNVDSGIIENLVNLNNKTTQEYVNIPKSNVDLFYKRVWDRIKR